MRNFSALFFALAFLPSLVSAVPGVSSTSGTFVQGSQITVSGSEFLAWSPDDILAWDNFENYTPGSEIPSSPRIGTWHKFNTADNDWTISALIDTTYRISGTQSMWGHRGLEDWSGASVYFDDLQKLYVSFWFRFNHQGPGQVKLMQVKGNQIGSCPDYHPQIATGDMSAEWWKTYIALDEPHGAYDGGCHSTDPYNSNYASHPGPDTWHFLEAIMTQGYPDVSNGSVEIRVNGARQFHAPSVLTRVLPASRWNLVQMINGMTNYTSSNTWVDDMYVARSFARMLLCDASTYSASHECHLQIPSTWSNSSIVATFNQGRFTAGQQAYLYVADSSGAISPSGHPLTIGNSGGGDTIPPAAPASLRTQ